MSATWSADRSTPATLRTRSQVDPSDSGGARPASRSNSMFDALSHEVGAPGPAILRTIQSALAARSVFFRRELQHCLHRTDPRVTLAVLGLGGDGRDLFQFAMRERWSSAIDALLVSRSCDRDVLVEASGWSRDVLEGDESLARFEVRQQCVHDYLMEATAGSVAFRDLVLCPDLLDEQDDIPASDDLRRAIELVRPGGIVLCASFDSELTDAELESAVTLEISRTRPRARSADDLDRIVTLADPSQRHRTTQLERGPNRYLLLRRGGTLPV